MGEKVVDALKPVLGTSFITPVDLILWMTYENDQQERSFIEIADQLKEKGL